MYDIRNHVISKTSQPISMKLCQTVRKILCNYKNSRMALIFHLFSQSLFCFGKRETDLGTWNLNLALRKKKSNLRLDSEFVFEISDASRPLPYWQAERIRKQSRSMPITTEFHSYAMQEYVPWQFSDQSTRYFWRCLLIREWRSPRIENMHASHFGVSFRNSEPNSFGNFPWCVLREQLAKKIQSHIRCANCWFSIRQIESLTAREIFCSREKLRFVGPFNICSSYGLRTIGRSYLFKLT